MPTDTTTAAVEVRDLVVHFDGVKAVDGISFTLPYGQTLGLLGGNGSGKTTTISALLGLVLPTRGTVRVLGADMVTRKYAALPRMNYVSSDVRFPARMSVRQILHFYGGLYEVRGLKTAIREVSTELRLTELLSRRFGDLSAGQKTRVALAKALLNQPELLLLDEPTASLDPQSEEWVLRMLEEYRDRTGCSIVIVTHNMYEVQRLCTDVVMLGHGRIIEQGTTAELLAKYSHDSLRPVFLDIASDHS